MAWLTKKHPSAQSGEAAAVAIDAPKDVAQTQDSAALRFYSCFANQNPISVAPGTARFIKPVSFSEVRSFFRPTLKVAFELSEKFPELPTFQSLFENSSSGTRGDMNGLPPLYICSVDLRKDTAAAFEDLVKCAREGYEETSEALRLLMSDG